MIHGIYIITKPQVVAFIPSLNYISKMKLLVKPFSHLKFFISFLTVLYALISITCTDPIFELSTFFVRDVMNYVTKGHDRRERAARKLVKVFSSPSE